MQVNSVSPTQLANKNIAHKINQLDPDNFLAREKPKAYKPKPIYKSSETGKGDLYDNTV